MAHDTLLREALRALKAKIETAAAFATPEELAYLGTALERIGGRATLLEVEDIGDQKKAELQALAAQLSAALASETSSELAAFRDQLAEEIATMTSAAEALLTTTGLALDALANAKLASVQAVTSQLQTAGALAQQQALNGSLYINYFFANAR